MVQALPQYDTAGGNVVADKRVVLRYRLNNDLNVIHRYADLGGTLQVASGTFGYLCPCQLGAVDFFWIGERVVSSLGSGMEKRVGGAGGGASSPCSPAGGWRNAPHDAWGRRRSAGAAAWREPLGGDSAVLALAG